MTCPSCRAEVEIAYDSFEDMYRCSRPECWVFFYPEELELVENPEAGIWKVGVGAAQ